LLAHHCAGDDALRREVDALLAAEAESGAFLADPALAMPCSGGAAALAVPGGELPRLGPRLRVLEKLAEGGSSDVYVAEQLLPLRRKVALKVLRSGQQSRTIVARFEAERQTLAEMDHPGIARVFDAGATEDGRPYFVMELVQGVPVTEFCILERMPVAERLRLLIQVCRAVQHAHGKGVIHRDLKPSNVLVTRVDGHPAPKVIDFGIAKAVRGPAGEPLLPDHRQLVGTPAYMSPEQVSMAPGGVDIRSDIYALGVILYELLTGATPFDATRLRAATLEEFQRCLREETPLRPSIRVAGMRVEEKATAWLRDFPVPVRDLRGDLDRIVMQALEKEPDHRYETAAALADDIARHLAHEPVRAGRATGWYRLGKFVRRYRAGMAAALVALVALLVGAGVAVYGMRSAHREAAARRRSN